MNASTRKARFALVALLALVGFGTSLADQAFFHTDDGCEVELHCLACRSASVVAATGLCAAPPAIALCRAEAVDGIPRLPPCSIDRNPIESRGPPAAS